MKVFFFSPKSRAMETRDHSKNGVNPKNHRSRRNLLSALLIALLICSANFAQAQTVVASGTCGTTLQWTITSDSTLHINGTGAMTDYVTNTFFGGSLAPWNTTSYRALIAYLAIGDAVGDAVDSLGNNAFYQLTKLRTATIPNTVTAIGSGVFSGCSILTSATLGSALTTIGGNAITVDNLNSTFSNCPLLAAINVVTGNAALSSFDGIVYDATQTTLIRCPAAKGDAVTISNSATQIGANAFANCNKIKVMTIGSGMQTIPANTFDGCTLLDSIAVNPANVTFSASNGLLYNLTTLIKCPVAKAGTVTISNAATQIGANAFANCNKIKVMVIGSGMQTIPANTFDGCTLLDSIAVDPTNVTFSASNGLLYNLTTLARCPIAKAGIVIISNAATQIASNAFTGCTKVKVIYLGSGIQNIETSVFSGCTILDSIVVSPSNSRYSSIDGILYTAAKDTLLRCPVTRMDTVAIHTATQEIAAGAFTSCSKIRVITMGPNMQTIPANAFNDCSLLDSIAVDPANIVYSSVNGVIYKQDTVFRCPIAKATPVVIPNTMTQIASNAFTGCTKVPAMTVGSGIKNLPLTLIGSTLTLLNTITVDAGNLRYSSYAGILYNQTKDSLLRCPLAKVDSVMFPATGLQTIGEEAFRNCTLLTKNIIVPSSVLRIGIGAFRSCRTVKTIDISNTQITTLSNYTFNSCAAMTSLILPNSILTIGNTTLYGCSVLQEVVVGNNVSQIPAQFCQDLYQLKTVTLGSSVTSLASEVFGNCTQLRTIKSWATVPPSLMPQSTFSGAAPVNTITVYVPCGSDSAYRAIWGAYSNSYSYSPLYFSDYNFVSGMTPLRDSLYNRSPLTCSYTDDVFTTPILTSGTYRRNAHAQNGCDTLRYVLTLTMPSGTFSASSNGIMLNYRVVSCDDNTVAVTGGADANGGALVIPDTVENTNNLLRYTVVEIDNSAFRSKKYASVSIPNTVITIGDNAFQYDSLITTVTMGNSVETIGTSAFHFCTRLNNINLPNSITRIKNAAFAMDNRLTSIVFPNAVTTIEQSTFQFCTALTSLTFPNSSVTTIAEAAFYGCWSLTDLILPNSLKTIDRQAFLNCFGLTSMVIPNSVTAMESGAFSGCINLVSVFLSDSLTELKTNVFSNCYALKSITIGTGITRIGRDAFAYDSTLMEVVIPDQVTVIEGRAFANCPMLSRLTIGSAVDSIKYSAFEDCPLATIYSRSTTPPVLSTVDNPMIRGVFYGRVYFAEVYVPCRALGAYLADTTWGHYFYNSTFYRTFALDTIRYTGSYCVEKPYSDAHFTNVSGLGIKYAEICDTLYELTLSLATVAKPTTPTATCVTGVSLNVNWTANNNMRYLVYRAEGGTSTYTLVDTVNSGSYTDANVVVGEYYCYKLKAMTAEGCLSDLSDNSCATMLGLADVKVGSLAIYPNPATTEIKIKGENGKTLTGNVQIIDMMGKTVISVPAQMFDNEPAIDISTLPAGFYTVRIGSYTGKFVKK